MQDLASIASKILARREYFLQNGFYWEGLGREPVLHTATMAAILQRSTEKRRTTAKEMTRTSNAHTLLTSKECVNHMIVHLTHQGFTMPQIAQLLNPVAGRLSLFVTNWEVLTTDK